MQVNGACHCGKVTYRAAADPAMTALCNCTDCQTMSGGPFRWVLPSQAGLFQLLTGAVKTYIKTAESGRKREMGFCPDCGTQLYATSVDPGPKVYSLRVGAMAQRDQLMPKRQVWTRSAQPWIGAISGLPGTDK